MSKISIGKKWSENLNEQRVIGGLGILHLSIIEIAYTSKKGELGRQQRYQPKLFPLCFACEV